jgi:twinkle protein
MKSTKKESESKFDLDYCNKSIKTFDSQKKELLDIFRNGRKKGSNTHIRDIDNIDINGFKNKLWSWKKGELNLWTGYMNQGKSQFLIFICLLKAIKDDWKFAFFSPENDPPAEFFDDLVHTIIGETTDRNNKEFKVTEQDYLNAFKLIENHFFFVYPEDDLGKPDYTIENIERIFEFLIFEKNIDSVIVDPYIKIKHIMNIGEQEHLYASRFMMERVHFCRKQMVSYHLVMHQTTPRKDKDTGDYPPPDAYYIKGGGTFADSADNVLTVWRPHSLTDPKDDSVFITSSKIKKQKLVGFPSSVKMRFDRKKNRYISMDGYDYLGGGIEMKETETIPKADYYSVPKFHSNGLNDFENEKAPF